MAGKCVASGRIHQEITVCSNCFHKDVCGDKDYISSNDCCNFADKGRCVVLPCKVGDTVFSFRWSIARQKYDLRCGTAKSVRYNEPECSVTISDGEFMCELGKRIFLTREAAESALKEREKNGN